VTLARYVVGFAIQARPADDRDAESELISTALRDLDPVHFPATVAVSGALPISLEDEFEFGLELLLAGADLDPKIRARRKA
jgi:hypothetical protein